MDVYFDMFIHSALHHTSQSSVKTRDWLEQFKLSIEFYIFVRPFVYLYLFFKKKVVEVDL